MLKFYDPNQPEQFLEVPKLFGVVPIKQLVLVMQFVAMMIQIAFLCLSDNGKLAMLFQVIVIVMSAFTFAAFLVENKVLIRAHYYFASIFTIVPVCVLIYFTYNFIGYLLSEKHGLFWDYSKPLVVAIAFACAHFFYLLMCQKLIKAFEKQPETLPELDTTQGLFHFNRDAYDGSERVKLIYPEV